MRTVGELNSGNWQKVLSYPRAEDNVRDRDGPARNGRKTEEIEGQQTFWGSMRGDRGSANISGINVITLGVRCPAEEEIHIADIPYTVGCLHLVRAPGQSPHRHSTCPTHSQGNGSYVKEELWSLTW